MLLGEDSHCVPKYVTKCFPIFTRNFCPQTEQLVIISSTLLLCPPPPQLHKATTDMCCEKHTAPPPNPNPSVPLPYPLNGLPVTLTKNKGLLSLIINSHGHLIWTKSISGPIELRRKKKKKKMLGGRGVPGIDRHHRARSNSGA